MSRHAVNCFALLLSATPLAMAQKPLVIGSAESDIWHHRLGPERAVHLIPSDLAGVRFIGMESVEFELIVSADGRVESAHPVTGKAHMSNVPAHLDEAQAIELSRTFKPWLQNGVPVRVQVNDYVSLLPPEQYAATHVPFPDVAGISSFTIGLSRTACFGTCPAYELSLDSSGEVHFSGHSGVFIQGDHVAHVSPDKVRELLLLFRKADFFSAKDVYRGNWSDSPTQKVSLSIGTLSKTVTDYVGTDVGLPLAIRNLEEQIDEAADTRRWILFTDATLPSLDAEHWDFAAATPANVSFYAATLGNPALVQRFLAAHAPIVSPAAGVASPVCIASGGGNLSLVRLMMQGHSPLPGDVMSQCLLQAASSGDGATFQFWLDQGATPGSPAPASPGNWIAALGPVPAAVFGGNLQIIQKLLDRGAPLPQKINDEPILSWALQHGRAGKKQPLLAFLAAAGADPNGRDWMGQTPLIANNFEPDLVRPLLSAGANIEARDNNGRTALIAHAVSEAMIRELLAAGADPTVADNRGHTALTAARQYGCLSCAQLIQQALEKRADRLLLAP